MRPMPRGVRLESRVSPELAEAIDQARDMASVRMWLERAAQEKLARDGVEVQQAGPPLQRGSTPAEPPPEPPPWPRLPPPRRTGGRRMS